MSDTPDPRIEAVADELCDHRISEDETPCWSCRKTAVFAVAALNQRDAAHPDEVPWLEFHEGVSVYRKGEYNPHELLLYRVRQTGGEQ
jgi:hypothetical protein